MGKMLINATQADEVRVALVEGNTLYDLDIDSSLRKQTKGNIYSATVTRCEPSLNAVFVRYGVNGERQGFLSLKEIAPEYLNPSSKKASAEDKKELESEDSTQNSKNSEEDKRPITSLLREGQVLLVQVDKEERGTKGAALTTFITLAGCYLVLMPNNPNSGGISRRIEGDDREELRETLNSLELPDGMGLIIRTAGVGKSQEELQSDLDMLCNLWTAIKEAYKTQIAPCLIHQESDVIIRSIRDNLRKSITEIIIDDHVSFVRANRYLQLVKPKFSPTLSYYNSPIPLFIFYPIETQIESAYQREVPLSSGGTLVIDRTEALVSIDINSAKATSATDIETTARDTNLAATEEIARQLRLRDLGGLIVIDFIDMSSSKNQREVEARLKEALKADRARIQVGRISRFGLLEMSRQRLRLSLGETAQEICPRCDGRGTVRNVQSHGLSILRLIEEEALKDKTAEVQVQLPVELATFIMNEKRQYIISIEKRHAVSIIIVANPHMNIPQYSITRIKEDNVGKSKKQSFNLIQPPEVTLTSTSDNSKTVEPAVQHLTASTQASKKSQSNLIKRVWNSIFGGSAETKATSTSSQRNETDGQVKKQKPHHHQSNRRRRPTNATGGQQQGQGQQQQRQASNSNPQQQRRKNPHYPRVSNRTDAPKTKNIKEKEPTDNS